MKRNDSDINLAKSMAVTCWDAQQAELFALTRACIFAKNNSATIYTDSRYAFGVVHDVGTLWKRCGFLTSPGTPIKNAKCISNLLEAVLLPSRLAIIKCQAAQWRFR